MSIKHFLSDETGAASIEYAVMLALIIAICFAAVDFFGGETSQLFSNFNASLTDATGN